MDEGNAVVKLYALISAGSIGLTFLEYEFLSSVKDMFAFNMLQDTLDNWPIHFEATVMLSIGAVSVMMIASQLRIEYDAFTNDVVSDQAC